MAKTSNPHVGARGAPAGVGTGSGLSRRSFLQITAAGALALYVPTSTGLRRVFAAPIPGGTLSPRDDPDVPSPLVIPPAMPTDRRRHLRDRGPAVRRSRSCRPGCRRRRCGATARSPIRSTFNYPAFTIEADAAPPTTVTWINGLVDGRGASCPTCCPSIRRCTGPTRPAASTDATCDPTFTSTPGPYTRAGARSPSTCTAWRASTTGATATPRPGTCPTRSTSRRATPHVGTWHDFFAAKAAAAGVAWGAGGSRPATRTARCRPPSGTTTTAWASPGSTSTPARRASG